MTLALLLGEAPGLGGGTGDPLGKRTARRLCEFAGWEPEGDGDDPYRVALAKRYELRNLLEQPTGKAGKGTRFPVPEARRAAARLDFTGRAVVSLGKRVAEAIGAPADYFVVRRSFVTGTICVTIPHPSGINRRLNDPEVRHAAGEVLRMFAGSC